MNQIIPFGERAVLRLRAVLANFDEARAHELLYDNPPPSYKSDQNMDEVVKTMSGAVIISVRPTSLIVYPGSHRLGCGHKFRPYRVHIPAGCMLIFANVAHAGFGITNNSDALLVPCPNSSDWMAKPTTDLNWRGHLYFDKEDVEQANNNYTYFVKDLHKSAVESFSPISEGRMFDFYPLIFLPNDSKLPGQTLQELRNSTLQWDEKSEEAIVWGHIWDGHLNK